jgi:ribosomal protein S12 methylthiotransferase accessory factor
MELRISFAGGLKVDAAFDGGVVRTDQPVEAGGEGSAPSPFNVFLASLGTCAGIYVLRFLQTHGLPTEGVHLTQRVEWDAAGKRVGRIGLDIHVPAGFPEKHLKALERTADLCAVKRAIANPPEFSIRAIAG